LIKFETALVEGPGDLPKDLAPIRPDHPGERKLLENVPELFIELDDSDSNQREAVISVVRTLIQGMLWDQELFDDRSLKNSGLTEKQMERYTYLVAGCVGPFWSKVCAQGDPRLSHFESGATEKTAVEFGKALQFVNILRDIPADQLEGRFYLPDLNSSGFPERFRWTSQRALEAFDQAIRYPVLFPRGYFRHRLAVIMPLLLGLRTLELLFRSGGPRQGNRVKVSRKEVFLWLGVAPALVWNNRLVHSLLEILIKRASLALELMEYD
jgi:farnesyl-diphosphate farnesyltransferase